jgi:hypothetical protein
MVPMQKNTKFLLFFSILAVFFSLALISLVPGKINLAVSGNVTCKGYLSNQNYRIQVTNKRFFPSLIFLSFSHQSLPTGKDLNYQLNKGNLISKLLLKSGITLTLERPARLLLPTFILPGETVTTELSYSAPIKNQYTPPQFNVFHHPDTPLGEITLVLDKRYKHPEKCRGTCKPANTTTNAISFPSKTEKDTTFRWEFTELHNILEFLG